MQLYNLYKCRYVIICILSTYAFCAEKKSILIIQNKATQVCVCMFGGVCVFACVKGEPEEKNRWLHKEVLNIKY